MTAPENKSRIKHWMFETGKTLKWLERTSEVNYTTIEELAHSRLLMYQHRTLRDIAKAMKWSIPELLKDIVEAKYTKSEDIEKVVKLCKRYNIETNYKLPEKKKTKKSEPTENI